MADTFQYLLGPHGVFEGSVEDVQARGYDPWQSQLFTEAMVPEQFGQQRFTWSGYGVPGGADLGLDYSTGYLPGLLDLRAAVQSGAATAQERERYARQVQQAQAIPLRDVSGLTYDAGSSGTGQTLSGASPDLGGIMLQLAEKLEKGTATAQERDLFRTTESLLRDQNWRASVPQPSDAFNPLGDQFFGALGTLALGATGGLAAAPLAAGGAGLTTTLGSLGTLAGIGGTAAGALGQEMDIDWLRKAGLGLGAAGGIAGGIGGLANLASTGVNSLSDAARLASNAGRVVGGVGRLSNNDILRQAGGYLGMAGQLGGGVDTIANVLGGEGVNSLTDAARLARGLGQVASVAGRVTGNRPTQQASQMLGLASTLGSLGGGVGGLLSAAQGVQRGAVPFAPVDWLRR